MFTHFDSEDDYIDTSYFEDDWENLYGEGLEGTWYYNGDDTDEADKDDARAVVADWLRDDYNGDDH